MSDECRLMEDYIIQYTNKTIEEQNKMELINHLKYCPQCREELAFTLKLSEIVSKDMKEIPEEILNNMFSKIPESNEKEDIIIVSKFKSALEPLEIVTQILSTAKKSVNLAFQFV
ncbi:hypothetical protein [Clostridium sp. Cult3]|uniref:hypothetical protein n=1 Tax=Clostridium sp. Cult3 TaxID=2079004 RepID=UPI001F2FF789|nr:hypothetical protein [Clostridium sp. Cult3]MCF6460327.1 hypothetical protein [Clostridium sp. Cult3]